MRGQDILAMTGGHRKKLCIDHETMFRERLVVYVDDLEVARKLGIETR